MMACQMGILDGSSFTSLKARLNSKEGTLSVAVTNTESVRSTIEDADFAREQMEMMKLQIIQQTALSSLTQSNSSPQLVLGLFE